jgi:hypothetical protein
MMRGKSRSVETEDTMGIHKVYEYYGMKLLIPTMDTAGSIGGIYLQALKKLITEWIVIYP